MPNIDWSAAAAIAGFVLFLGLLVFLFTRDKPKKIELEEVKPPAPPPPPPVLSASPKKVVKKAAKKVAPKKK